MAIKPVAAHPAKPSSPVAPHKPAVAPKHGPPLDGLTKPSHATPRLNGRSWDYPAGLSSGVFLSPGANPHPVELVDQSAARFPGSKTYLYYKSIGSDPTSLPPEFFAHARAHGITPQVGFESGDATLAQMQRALAGKGKLPEDGGANSRANELYNSMSRWADYLKDKGPVIFRPLSEMNDASGAWEMGKPGNTPQEYAAVWNGMHQLFDEHGARNLRWSFDVLAVAGTSRADKVRTALSLIPPQNIDNVAMNPYAMHSGGQFESFGSLCTPWLEIFKETGHGHTRPVVSEMGVSNNPRGHNVDGNKDAELLKPGTPAYQKLDAERAQWIHEAFAFARAHDFASVTYFTQMNTNWRVDAGSLADQALKKEIARS
jgi:hypothetical protein